jgi:hypothetical protein
MAALPWVSDVVSGREWLLEDQLANLAATPTELAHDVVRTSKHRETPDLIALVPSIPSVTTRRDTRKTERCRTEQTSCRET